MSIPQNPSPITPTPKPVAQREAAPAGAPAAPPVAGDDVVLGRPTPAVCPFTGMSAVPAAAPEADAPPAAASAPPAGRPASESPAPVLAVIEDTSAGPLVKNWRDPAPTSQAQRQAFQDQVTALQNKLVATGKVPEIARGFHQKQNWGGKATITFDPNMPAALRKDAFANVAGQSFTTAIRFSNGQGCPHMDSKPDVRGMAAKMNLGGQEVDILATNHITFARDAAQFMRFAEIAGTMQTDGNLSAIHELLSKVHEGEYSARETLRIAGRLIKDTSHKTQNIAKETYWSQAVKVGDLVGRFVFTPDSGAESKKGWHPDENYLREGFEKDLEKHDITMRVGFEAFTDDEVASDASVHGDHITFPVGVITFQQRSAAARDHEEAVVDKMSFNPSNGMRMAGTMNESNRAAIYQQSAANRHAQSWDSPDVAAFFGRAPAPPAS